MTDNEARAEAIAQIIVFAGLADILRATEVASKIVELEPATRQLEELQAEVAQLTQQFLDATSRVIGREKDKDKLLATMREATEKHRLACYAVMTALQQEDEDTAGLWEQFYSTRDAQGKAIAAYDRLMSGEARSVAGAADPRMSEHNFDASEYVTLHGDTPYKQRDELLREAVALIGKVGKYMKFKAGMFTAAGDTHHAFAFGWEADNLHNFLDRARAQGFEVKS